MIMQITVSILKRKKNNTELEEIASQEELDDSHQLLG